MDGFRHLVVALGSVDSDEALIAYAALIARLGQTREVRFVHVAEPSASSADLRSAMRAHVAATFHVPAVRTECDVLHGPLTDRVLDYVTQCQADLVLIGAKRHKLGARLAMVAPCSVAVVPNGHPARLSHLMVALDFSGAAVDTLEWATALVAADPSVRCTALHVITHESTDMFAEGEDEAEQASTVNAILLRANRHGVPLETRLVPVSRTTDVGRSHRLLLPASIEGADVAHTILAEAEACGADCIALSTRGRTLSASVLLGSVTEKVIERSSVPLLVSKHKGSRNLDLVSILLGRATPNAGVKTN